MKYVIEEILVNQLRVKFEDESLAIVPIREDMSLDEIDDAVSKYDPDNLPKIVNPNISVGEARTSKILEVEDSSSSNNNQIIDVNSVSQEPQQEFTPFEEPTLYGGLPMPPLHKDQVIMTYVLADYFIKHNNDDSLRKALDSKIEEYVTSNEITVEMVLESLTYQDDNLILKIAEQELQNEQQIDQ